MIHQQHERAALLGRKLQPRRHALGEKCACLGMGPCADAFAGIVQEQGEIENVGIGDGLEQFLVGTQLRVIGVAQRIEFFNTDQGVLVGGITMEIFVLHQAGEVTKLREIASEEIDLVHHAKDARDVAFAAKNARKNLSRRFSVTKRARDEAQAPAQQIGQLGAQFEAALLGMLECLHQLLRFPVEELRIAHMQLPAAAEEFFEVLFR